MKTIRTACGSFLTGSDIADAVTGYGLALARARDVDVVDIPFIAEGGVLNRAQIRIGWLIETVVTADERPWSDELIEVDTIFDLLAKSRSLTSARSPVVGRGWQVVHSGTNWDEFI